MKRKSLPFVAALLAFAGVLGVFFTQSKHGVFAENTPNTSRMCGDIVFGNTLSNSSTVLQNSSSFFSTTNLTVSSLTIASGSSVTKAKDSDAALKLGTSSASGSVTFTFSTAWIIQKAVVTADRLSSGKATSALTLSTSANPTGVANTIAYNGNSTTTYDYVLQDVTSTASSTALTLANGGSGQMIYVCKILLTLYNPSSPAVSSSAVASSSTPSSISSSSGSSTPITFNFVRQGNSNTGDCTYIKAGDTDILIDAGNRTGSASVIETYLEDSSRTGNYVSDGKLEYVIATHAHQDHIAGFVGNSSSTEAGGKDGILYHYQVDHLLDFSYYDDTSGTALANTVTDSSSISTSYTTAVYRNYVDARNYAISKGTNWQTAGQMWASSAHTISLGTNLSMTLLYNYFYDHTHSDLASFNSTWGTSFAFSEENDCSVSVLFTQGNKNFLFTGDSEAAAEYSLTKYNSLPQVELFKGGHHGSYTANTDALLSVIKPKLICICCCTGNSEYASTSAHSFPAQEAINRIAPYTDRVYVTDLGSFTDRSYCEPMNGNIVVAYDSLSAESLSFSNNSTKLKDTAWFSSNRTLPSAWA